MKTDIAPCPPIAADATQMHQVIMNLATNAIQALSDGERQVKIALRPEGVDEASGRQRARSFAQLTVTDTGSGMDEDVLPRIFEPFFSTKTSQGSCGLGLSMVHGIVTAHGGDLSVTSRLGEGSAFKVRIPLMARELESTRQPGQAELPSENCLEVLSEEAKG